MNRVVRQSLLLLALIFLCWQLPVRAQESAGGSGGDLAAAYSQAMQLFQAGKYAEAASALENLLNRAEFSPQLEPVYYTIGSAWFNAGQYSKAVAAFRKYQAKFPQGAHAGSVAFAIAQSNLLAKNYSEAASQVASLQRDPVLREQAMLFEAQANKAAGETDAAIAVLEKLLGSEIHDADQMRGASLLAQLSAQKGDGAKALRVLQMIHQKIALADNIVELNALAVQLGDKFFGKEQFAAALACYRYAFPREQLVRLQNQRITAMQQRIEQNLETVRTHPDEMTQLAPVNNQLKEEIASAQKLLAEFEKLPTITPAIYLRLARCFYELDRKWEAVVVYDEILDRFKESPAHQPALFGLIIALADINQPQRAEERCQEYLRDFKNGPNAETVGYLSGAVALQAGNAKTAETYFNKILETQPKSKFREQIRYLLANAKFSEGDYAAAKTAYDKYLSDFPHGISIDDVKYRIALCALFGGKYQSALDRLQTYVKEHPQSNFIPDARYRIAVCLYAASQYDQVIADCQSWEKDFPENQQLGEVLSLLGDAYAASGREAAAIPVYVRSYQTATTDQVMNYSLTAASKLLQKQGDWNKVADLFSNFIKDKPDNPAVVTAIYWIGKAKAHEGKIDEAKQLAAETIRKYIDDPNREAVEQLITELAQLCVKSPRGAATPPADPGAELDQLLANNKGKDSPTAKARILFAKAEFARLRRQPAEVEKNLSEIARYFKSDDLSPLLLGKAGDYLLSKGDLDRASTFYEQLMTDFPKSQMVDYAYNGLGEIAYEKKDYNKALGYFNDGLDKIAAAEKLKEITVGRARTLLALGRLDEAQKAFEQIASVREWRGESTALAVYSLGEIASRRGKWAEANAYFQRVYVGYQKFLPWVAKAYVASGESFEKLNKKEEAANTYKEMLRNDKLTGFAETAEARKRLEALGQG